MCAPDWGSGIVILVTPRWCPVPWEPQRYWKRVLDVFRPLPDSDFWNRSLVTVVKRWAGNVNSSACEITEARRRFVMWLLAPTGGNAGWG